MVLFVCVGICVRKVKRERESGCVFKKVKIYIFILVMMMMIVVIMMIM